jgi:hypothetical protein
MNADGFVKGMDKYFSRPFPAIVAALAKKEIS